MSRKVPLGAITADPPVDHKSDHHGGEGALEPISPSPSPPLQPPFGGSPPLQPNLLRSKISYDAKIAYLLSVVSGWAYSDKQTLANKLQFYGLPSATVTPISVTNEAMGVVARAFFIRSKDGKVGILAFRGTEPSNAINWLTNAYTTLKPFHGGKIHSGFHANVEALWSDIYQQIDAAINGMSQSERVSHADISQTPLRPIEHKTNGSTTNGISGIHESVDQLRALYITGHSLGGAMAVITAAKIFMDSDYDGWKDLVRGVYTFGQPMVGDRNFASLCKNEFGDMLYRHVYRRDVVPCLPSKDIDEFKHFGHELFASLPQDQWQRFQKPMIKASRLAIFVAISVVTSFFTKRIARLKKFDCMYSLIDDHSPNGYIETCRVSADG